jgi:hypothetical protein
MHHSRAIRLAGVPALALIIFTTAAAQQAALPQPDSAAFCETVQEVLANTDVSKFDHKATVFDNMPDYRASKPSVNPLNIYQVVTYEGSMPIVVSCKVKTSDHLIAEYGAEAAGKQRYCPEISKLVVAQAAEELQAGNPEAAAAARAIVIEATEPYATGASYLSDFQSIVRAADGSLNVITPGLQTDWENWIFWIMPDRVRGQTYCHIPTVEYVKAVVTGALEPGQTIHTRDDAPTMAAAE